jgi:hypothetical protein
VLDVNYRSSTGYGRTLTDDGEGQLGRRINVRPNRALSGRTRIDDAEDLIGE